jgi:parvulin-like peptidyl-prolyl isomerase
MGGTMLKKLLREPLVHFLFLGVVFFLAFSLVNKRTSGDTRRIVVTLGEIEHLQDTFTRAHQRRPDEEELTELVRDFVREEIYYREALALGLDRDDAPIRQRLRQKMEFISEDVAAQTEPTEDQLRSYLNSHPDKFRVDQHFTFSQIYLDTARRGRRLKADAQQMLAELNKAGTIGDVSQMGDPFLLDQNSQDVSARDVARDFGEKFAAVLIELPVGNWQGPIESGLGMHLVYVSKRTDGRIPQLNEVRDAVRREWANEYRVEANETFYKGLRKRYTVTVDLPQPSAAENAQTGAERP